MYENKKLLSIVVDIYKTAYKNEKIYEPDFFFALGILKALSETGAIPEEDYTEIKDLLSQNIIVD